MNPVYLIEIERIHTADRNPIAVSINDDALSTRSRAVGIAWSRSTDRVNLVYTIEDERIHAFDRNRHAVPIKRDPL